MLRITLLAAILMGFTTAAQPDPDCDEPAQAFDGWFAPIYEDLLQSDDASVFSTPELVALYGEFADYVLDYVGACADADTDLAYEGEFDDGDDWHRNDDILLSVIPMDVNLDGVDDWLLRLHIGPPGGGRTFVRLLYQGDDEWVMHEIWLPPTDDRTDFILAPQPQFVYVHEEADVQHHTYMGIYFYPGIGTEPYVGGLLVLRWDGWVSQEIMFIEQDCVFHPWERGEDGGLYIPQSSAVPWQGCTYPNHPPEEGIPVPGAEMPEDE